MDNFPKVLSGKTAAENILEHVKSEAVRLAAQGTKPGLAVVIVGHDPASQVYVGRVAKFLC